MSRLRKFTLCLFIVASAFGAAAQNYIGLHKDEIRTRVKKELPGFYFAKEVESGDRSFIKFENTFEEQTLIFRLNQKGNCTSVSRMYNTWLEDKIRAQLDASYGKGTGNHWYFTSDGKRFEVVLKQSDWYLTVITKSVTN